MGSTNFSKRADRGSREDLIEQPEVGEGGSKDWADEVALSVGRSVKEINSWGLFI